MNFEEVYARAMAHVRNGDTVDESFDRLMYGIFAETVLMCADVVREFRGDAESSAKMLEDGVRNV